MDVDHSQNGRMDVVDEVLELEPFEELASEPAVVDELGKAEKLVMGDLSILTMMAVKDVRSWKEQHQ